jgi:hypothetical protein
MVGASLWGIASPGRGAFDFLGLAVGGCFLLDAALRRAAARAADPDDETATGGPSGVRVRADAAARAFIQQHGGHVYVWASGELKSVAMNPPARDVEFVVLDGDGFTLYQDVGIASPAVEWHVVLRQFPHRHIDALWDDWEPDVSAGSPDPD